MTLDTEREKAAFLAGVERAHTEIRRWSKSQLEVAAAKHADSAYCAASEHAYEATMVRWVSMRLSHVLQRLRREIDPTLDEYPPHEDLVPQKEQSAIRHGHFWTMVREVRAYCRETDLWVVAKEDKTTRMLGYATDCPKQDVRYRAWEIKLTDLSLTANDRPQEFEHLSSDELARHINSNLMTSKGREAVARFLSTGFLPPP